jgi:hypothetical protein
MKEICIQTEVRCGLADRCWWWYGRGDLERGKVRVYNCCYGGAGGGVEQPEGTLRIRRRCLSDVVWGTVGSGA